ncbi:hypothetical protein GCM10010392_65940 [Streptomyces clavifer]|uniref:Uncharacterized protein n=1 Tax=Streptomyces clavifer TaxID=68188 RepID=A0ABS4VHV4_9ACTN|nr:hypothetical protein [Streptomyces clavifer]GHB28619.1 hypothetical protein GCM10010392_65940 [Streptomyces clavifer]
MIAYAYDNATSRAAPLAGFTTLQDDAATAPPTPVALYHLGSGGFQHVQANYNALTGQLSRSAARCSVSNWPG